MREKTKMKSRFFSLDKDSNPCRRIWDLVNLKQLRAWPNLIILFVMVVFISTPEIVKGYQGSDTGYAGAFSEGGAIPPVSCEECMRNPSQRFCRLKYYGDRGSRGRPLKCPDSDETLPKSCRDLESTVRRKANELTEEYRKWGGIETNYFRM